MVIAQSTLTYTIQVITLNVLGIKLRLLEIKGEEVTYDIVNMYAGWEELLSLV